MDAAYQHDIERTKMLEEMDAYRQDRSQDMYTFGILAVARNVCRYFTNIPLRNWFRHFGVLPIDTSPVQTLCGDDGESSIK